MPDGTKNDCKSCDGTGQVLIFEPGRHPDDAYESEAECEDCGGCGESFDDSEEEHPFAALASTETDDRLAKTGAL